MAKREHTNAASPPGLSLSIERAMKYSCSDSPSLPDGSSPRTVRSLNGGLPIARSKVSETFALVKSSWRTHASGCSSLAMRAVDGSISMAVTAVLAAAASGISARNRPVPQPGSRIVPPAKPMASTAFQTAWTMNSGV